MVASGRRDSVVSQSSGRRESVGSQSGGLAAGSVSVAVSLRLRPYDVRIDTDGPNAAPPPASAVHQVQLNDDGLQCSFRGAQHRFAHTFDAATPTSDIFEAHRQAVLSVLSGFDSTLMAYGATGSGKTYTMQGTGEDPGLTPLAIDSIFESIATVEGGQSYALQVSAMELLEERCVDLLHGRTPVVLRSATRDGGLRFHGLKERPVKSKAEVFEALAAAVHERTTAANYRHDASSRSHFIVRLRVDGARLMEVGGRGAASPARGGTPAADGALANVTLKDATSATLTLIDLAGSEAALQNINASVVAQVCSSTDARAARSAKPPSTRAAGLSRPCR